MTSKPSAPKKLMAYYCFTSGEHQRPDACNVHCLRDSVCDRPSQPDQQQACQQGGREEGGQEGGGEGTEGEEGCS